MRANRSTSAAVRKAAPLLLGAFGVICFSVTFPATTAAETSFNALAVGVGRSVIAAVLAIIVLAARRQPLIPPRAALSRLIIVAATVGVGFGLLSAIALREVDSVHTAVLTGLIPAATAGMAVLRAGERPRRGYWVALAFGLVVVAGFAVIQGGGRIRSADLLLLVAITIGGLGYAEGGALAREYGGWRVICWAVVLALPVTVPVTAAALLAAPPSHVSVRALAGLCYVGTVSMCIGFFAWYQGMALGGVARIGKLQLAQPALTLGWSAVLLGEHVSWLSAAAAAAVIAATAVGRNARSEGAAPATTQPATTQPATTQPATTQRAAPAEAERLASSAGP